jgi:hypothetical protein
MQDQFQKATVGRLPQSRGSGYNLRSKKHLHSLIPLAALTKEEISAIDSAGALGYVRGYKVILQRLVIAAAAAGIFWGGSRLLGI